MSGPLAPLAVLVLDGNKHLRQVLTPILGGAGIHNLQYTSDYKIATAQFLTVATNLLLVDSDGMYDQAVKFIRAARVPANRNHRVPIILLTSTPSRDQICAARDSGVNEILVKPVTTASVMDRLSRVILKPRPFISCETYCGPDRRRRNDVAYDGLQRRRVDGAPDLVY